MPAPEQIEFRVDDDAAIGRVIDRLRELATSRRGWVNFEPEVDPDHDRPPRSPLAALVTARGPEAPLATWKPGEERRQRVEPTSIGIQHASGPKAVRRLADGGIALPAYMSGPASHAWWAMIVLILVSGSLYGCVVFSYLYLWTVSPDAWPARQALPGVGFALAGAALLAGSSGCVGLANRSLAVGSRLRFVLALVAAPMLLIAALVVEGFAQRALSPSSSAYGAIVYLVLAIGGFFGACALAMVLFTIARAVGGYVDAIRRVTFDNARLFWHFTVAQGVVGLALVHGFPRLVG